MTVGDIISLGALLAGKDDVSADFAAGLANDSDNDVKKFYTAYNLTISELCEEVEPITTTERVAAEGGKIYYSDLSKKATRIIDVTADGKPLAFKIFPQYVSVDATAADITYAYAPEYVTDGGAVCPYDEKTFSKRTLATAVAAEYLITVGLFEEAVTLRKAFEDAISVYAIKKKRKNMKKRVWA